MIAWQMMSARARAGDVSRGLGVLWGCLRQRLSPMNILDSAGLTQRSGEMANLLAAESSQLTPMDAAHACDSHCDLVAVGQDSR
jgi:hypothetical protein